jgi:hypothetical protein
MGWQSAEADKTLTQLSLKPADIPLPYARPETNALFVEYVWIWLFMSVRYTGKEAMLSDKARHACQCRKHDKPF